jgi:putative ABC transport system substrate-binding protein
MTMRAIAWALLASLGAAATGQAAAQPKNVAITAIVEHPALDAVREGIVKGLADAGYAEGTDVVFTFESAQGNPATAAQIARQFVGQAPAVIVAISTPSAQAAAAATKEIPIVFSAVTDPAAAQLVESIDQPGGNITGVSDMAPIGDHVALIREITPAAKRIGVLYNPGEPNSVSSVAALKTAAEAAGMEVVEAPASRSADVQGAARSLVGKVDAIYVPTDNTIVSALESAIGVASEAKLPLYAADTDSVARGALAAVGFNYFDVGVQTAALVDRVLKGENPGAIPVAFASGTDLHVSKKTADAIGVTFPPAVLERASRIVE